MTHLKMTEKRLTAIQLPYSLSKEFRMTQKIMCEIFQWP